MSRSRVINIRVSDAEALGLGVAAADIGVTRSRLLRRLLREYLREHPDYFDDGLAELRSAHAALVAANRILRQHLQSSVRAADMRPALAELSDAVAALKGAMSVEITSARDRTLRVGDFDG